MRAGATCNHCGREFLLFQLYNASPAVADRCPHCSRHLGVVNVRGLAARIDRTAEDLAAALRELAAHKPEFRLDTESLLGPVTEAAAGAGSGVSSSHEAHADGARFPWRPRRQSRRLAA